MVLNTNIRASERPKTRGAVVLAVASDVIRRARYRSDADYADAVKCECARLRIPYTGAAVADAIALVRCRRALNGLER
jgi:hypothetical protein